MLAKRAACETRVGGSSPDDFGIGGAALAGRFVVAVVWGIAITVNANRHAEFALRTGAHEGSLSDVCGTLVSRTAGIASRTGGVGDFMTGPWTAGFAPRTVCARGAVATAGFASRIGTVTVGGGVGAGVGATYVVMLKGVVE